MLARRGLEKLYGGKREVEEEDGGGQTHLSLILITTTTRYLVYGCNARNPDLARGRPKRPVQPFSRFLPGIRPTRTWVFTSVLRCFRMMHRCEGGIASAWAESSDRRSGLHIGRHSP